MLGEMEISSVATPSMEFARKKRRSLKKAFFSHFREMFKEPQVRRPDMATELFKSIDSTDREVLEGPFSEEEVTIALAKLGGDKAPGPKVFSLAFWKSCSPTMGREVMQLFKEFHLQNSMTRSLNATFLVLLPKKGGARDMKDFRPINLLGSLYKLLQKS